jgi:hypothetical protein
MELNALSDRDLLLQFEAVVRAERRLMARVLEFIAEIDVRKIYLERAHSSLFDFLVNEMGYSNAAAMRRISGARLLREVPSVMSQVSEGRLNLTQLSQVQQACRSYKAETGLNLETDVKADLISQIAGSTQRQTEAIIARKLELPPTRQDRSSRHWDDSVTLTVTFDKMQMANLEQTKDIVAHAVPDGKWASVISYLSERELSRRAKSLDKQKFSTCQFKDPKTGRVCGAKTFLQIDHKQPRWAGGTDNPENLTVLCSAHNRYKYRQEAGITPARARSAPSQ